MPIRVLLADDHAIFRRGVHSLLAEYPDIEIVGEAENSPATLRQVAEHNPDVVLLDVQMEGASGVEVARTLRQNHPHVGVIILTTFDNDEYLFGAIQAGAHAYVLKDIALQTLPETIRAVWRGERLISTQLIGRVLQQFQDLANERVRRDTGLSPEDLDILRMAAEGATNQEIANRFFWSEVTVKKRMQEISQKLGAANRVQAVAIAIRRGLI
ncbi:MAG TPA: DNA-binding response regulator [Chloroflexi bacterium]|nr:DNA-binding response regulator [Chloroflexota bacterium]HHW87073.1 response regulator transcription factor [Chloroflexota bacterium]